MFFCFFDVVAWLTDHHFEQNYNLLELFDIGGSPEFKPAPAKKFVVHEGPGSMYKGPVTATPAVYQLPADRQMPKYFQQLRNMPIYFDVYDACGVWLHEQRQLRKEQKPHGLIPVSVSATGDYEALWDTTKDVFQKYVVREHLKKFTDLQRTHAGKVRFRFVSSFGLSVP